MTSLSAHPRARVHEGQCVEIDGQAYEVVHIDASRHEVVVNVADLRGRSLMLGHLTLPIGRVDEAGAAH